MNKKKKKKKYKKIPDSVKVSGGIPGLISGEKTYRYEEIDKEHVDIEQVDKEQIDIEQVDKEQIDKEQYNKETKRNDNRLTISQKQEVKIELDIKEKQEIFKDRDDNFQVKFDPELSGNLYPDSKDQLKCRVNFFSKKGTVAITKIWQHVGGESSFTKMHILDGESKEVIDGGWSEPNVFLIQENELKGIFLIFYKEKSWIEPNKVDYVGVKIETSEGDIEKEFAIIWSID